MKLSAHLILGALAVVGGWPLAFAAPTISSYNWSDATILRVGRISGAAVANGAAVVAVRARMAGNEIYSSTQNGSVVQFAFDLANTAPGDHELEITAEDANGGIASRIFTVHFPSVARIRVISPEEGAEVLVGANVTIRAEAEIDHGSFLSAGFAPNVGHTPTVEDTTSPYEAVFRRDYPGPWGVPVNARTEWEWLDNVVVNLRVAPLGLPYIWREPLSTEAALGTTASFSADVYSRGQPRYQWLFNGEPIANATGATLEITDVAAEDEGTYSVIIDNFAGRMLSAPASLRVTGRPEVGGGTIAFSNRTGSINAPVRRDSLTGPLLGSESRAQLYAGHSITNLAPVGTPVAFRDGNLQGYFNAGVVTLPRIAAGQRAFFQVWAWTLDGWGPGTYETSFNRGKSRILELEAGGETPALLTGLESFHTIIWDGYFFPGGTFQKTATAGERVTMEGPVARLTWTGVVVTDIRYEWFRDGQPLGVTTKAFEIPRAELSDAGNYMVVATEGTEVSIMTFNVEVQKVISLVAKPNGTLELSGAAAGDNFRIEVSEDLEHWGIWKSGVMQGGAGEWAREGTGTTFYRASVVP